MAKFKNKAGMTVALMMGATVIAKLLGMLRSTLLASHYGTGMEAEAFSAASRIPLSFFDMLFSAAILGCFIPVYNSFGKEREEEADRFACVFLNTVLLLTGALTLIGILLAEPIVNLIAPGLAEPTRVLASTLLRILFPMILFTGAAYTLVGVMQSKGHYLLPAVISAISNAAVILYFLLFDRKLGERGIYGLAFAYLAAWLIQMLTLAIPLARSGFRFRALLDFKSPELVRALKMAPPIMIGSWLSPLGVMIGTHFVSYTGVAGALTIFDYSNNVYVIIAGTLVYSICNYTFPSLSRLAAEGDETTFASQVRSGLSTALFISIPFMFAVLALSEEGISLLYLRGEFMPTDAELCASALRCFIWGMPAFTVIELMSRTFYSKGMVKPPMFAAIAGCACNALCAALLLRTGGGGVEAVTAANAAGQWMAAILLMAFACVKLRGIFDLRFFVRIGGMLLCGGALLAVMLIVKSWLTFDPYLPGFAGRMYNLISCIVIFLPGAAVYLLIAKLIGVFPGRKAES